MPWEVAVIPAWVDLQNIDDAGRREAAIERLRMRAECGWLDAPTANAIVQRVLLAEDVGYNARWLLYGALEVATTVPDEAAAAAFLIDDEGPNYFDQLVAPGGVLRLNRDTMRLYLEPIELHDGFAPAFAITRAAIDDRPVAFRNVARDEPARIATPDRPVVALRLEDLETTLPANLTPGIHVLRLSYDTIAFLGVAQNAVAEDPRFWQRGDVRELGLVSYRSSGSRDLPFLVHVTGSLDVQGVNPLVRLLGQPELPPGIPPPDPWRTPWIGAGFVAVGAVTALSVAVALCIARAAIRGAATLGEPSCRRCRSLLGPHTSRDSNGSCPECGAGLRNGTSWISWRRTPSRIGLQFIALVMALGTGSLLVVAALNAMVRSVERISVSDWTAASSTEVLTLARAAATASATVADLDALRAAIDHRDGLSNMEPYELREFGETLVGLTDAWTRLPRDLPSHPELVRAIVDRTDRIELLLSDAEWTRFRERFERPRVVVAPRARAGARVHVGGRDRFRTSDAVSIDGDIAATTYSSEEGPGPLAPVATGTFDVSLQFAGQEFHSLDPTPPTFTIRATVESIPPGESLLRSFAEGSIEDFMPPPHVTLREVGTRWLARLETSDVVADRPWLHVAGTWSFEGDGQRWTFPGTSTRSFDYDKDYRDVLVGPFPNGPPRRGVVRFVPDPSTLHLDDDEPADWWLREETFDVEPRIVRLGQ